MFGRLLNSISSTFSGLFSKSERAPALSARRFAPTMVGKSYALMTTSTATLPDSATTVEPERGVSKPKRFRRTAEELKLGLSIDEARSRREKAAAPVMKQLILKGQAVEKEAFEQLEDRPSPKVRARARAVSRYRARGGTAILTPETLDQIESFIASGNVKKCPAGIDSDGYDHFNQRETR